MPMRLVVLVSGSGTLLQALLDAIAAGELAAEVVAVGSDRPEAFGLQRATEVGIPVFVHALPSGADRDLWDAGLAEQIAAFEPDLVISAGFLKLIGPYTLARYGGRLVNTHPSLLPSFPGLHAVRDALAAGVKVTGATLFLVDAGLDTGEILAQEPVRVLADDTEETLHERIKQVERRMLIDLVQQHSQGDR